jgi:hypothetical protein
MVCASVDRLTMAPVRRLHRVKMSSEVNRPQAGGYRVCESVLIDIRIGAITGIATNGTQTGAAPPL